jgi:predicted Rossmann-fold nucleotide-binding protein
MPESVYDGQKPRARRGSVAGASPAASTSANSYDLTTPDGVITSVERVSRRQLRATVAFADVSVHFMGFNSGAEASFNLKSSIAQLGINSTAEKITIDAAASTVSAVIVFDALTPTLSLMALEELVVGSRVGKVFATEFCRSVRGPDYIARLQKSKDVRGVEVLSHGDWELKEIGGRTVAFLKVHPGVVKYGADMHGMLPTIGRALVAGKNFKELLRLHQDVKADKSRICTAGDVLMVRSEALRMVTMFGRVVDSLLPKGLKCLNSNVIEPHGSKDSADAQARTFVFHGESEEELTSIPIEFFTVECFREHIPFELRESLAKKSEDAPALLAAFATAPQDDVQACVFVSKGAMFDHMAEADWVTGDPAKDPACDTLGGLAKLNQAEQYLRGQCEYPVLSAITVGDINTDGVLLTKFFPSPVTKSLMLSRQVTRRVKAIYFLQASRSNGSFFTQEDRGTLLDLFNFGIKVYHVDRDATSVFEYKQRIGTHSGMFVPLARRAEFDQATFFGVYGSNLVAGDFEAELTLLMKGVLELKKTTTHPLLNADKPIALITGGGPGAMEVGNRVAKTLGILSCGMFVDFGLLAKKPGANINEQKKNPYVEAYMSYLPQKLVERQSDFNLDFPIFLTGGVGTDFEYALEEVRRKVGIVGITPMILFGDGEHYGKKIGARFGENEARGVIKNSEWLSNVPHVVKSGREALAVIQLFARGQLAIGGKAPANKEGFIVVDEALVAKADASAQ